MKFLILLFIFLLYGVGFGFVWDEVFKGKYKTLSIILSGLSAGIFGGYLL